MYYRVHVSLPYYRASALIRYLTTVNLYYIYIIYYIYVCMVVNDFPETTAPVVFCGSSDAAALRTVW